MNGTGAQGNSFRDLAQRIVDRINQIGPPSGPKIEISE
jgi:hypothetical protein